MGQWVPVQRVSAAEIWRKIRVEKKFKDEA